MLLHKQASKWHLTETQKNDLTDMVLVAINEVSKSSDEENRAEIGVDFTNIIIATPDSIADVLKDLGYKDEEFETNNWQCDYWQKFTHDTMPTMQLSGTAFIHTCKLSGDEDDTKTYASLEHDPNYAKRIEHGLVLIKNAIDIPEKS